ncbi:VOC family protein [Kutzneria kofuensis]|uniref:Putative glyoxalase superfamily protein PhnB n=1 Tax=Kutzneria kofuensis TaxID=103725 RepID=A0A7W9KK74_9PSEU|nr:VOC family protein [Kutzneria kofuensis]MBB5893967.1 putative glyoxalase superfamily protein PhnB [Kutzneria kofuensis]
MHPNSDEVIFACRPNLLVDSVAVSLRFYAEVLGFRIGWRWSDPEARFLDDDEPDQPGTALVGRDGVQILLTQNPGEHTTRLHLDVHTAEQVDGLFQEWADRGARVAEPPVVRPWGMYEMRLHDPDGNVLRVSAPATGR